jgi:hypothetical protein
MKADERSARRLDEIIEFYSKGSGQKVNKQKSFTYFSPNCLVPVRILVRNESILRKRLCLKNT